MLSPTSPATRFRRALFCFLALLIVIQISPVWRPTPDATSYLSIARSAWSGHGLTNLGGRQLHYPVGYPLTIAPLFLLSSESFLLLAITRALMAIALLAAIYTWARGIVSTRGALFVTAAVTCNTSFWLYYRTPLSELPMMLWMFLGALALRRALAARGNSFWCLAALSVLLVSLAAYTRQSALALAAGTFVAAIFPHSARGARPASASLFARFSRAAALVLLVSLPALVGLFILARYDQAMVAPTGHTYLDELAPTRNAPFHQVLVNLHVRISETGRLLVPGLFSAHGKSDQLLDPLLLLYLPVTLLVAMGWWRLARRRSDPMLWAAPFYAGLYLLWPFDQDTRFFTPLLPILSLSLWPAFQALAAKAARSRTRILAACAVAFCAAHLAVAVSIWIVQTRQERADYRASYAPLQTLARDIQGSPLPLASRGITENQRLWLQFLADRPIRKLDPQEPPPAGALLIVPAGKSVPGFAPRQTVGGFSALAPGPP